MKIRILDPGFANLTGLLGTTEFVDGVSVDEVSRAEAERLGTILSIENADTGVNPSLTQHMVDTHNKNVEELGLKFANLRKATTTQPEVAENQPEVVPQGAPVQAPVQPPAALSYDYTIEQLDALVAKEGIAGLRAFADQYGINDKSIAGLVKKLMDEKAVFTKPAQKEPEPESDEENDVVEETGPVGEPAKVEDAEELEKALGDVEQE